MTAADVRALVEQQIAGDWQHSNAHGVDLRRCLVEPQKLVYDIAGRSSESCDMWLVLEEDPDDQSGYKIVYDEAENMFGLAIAGSERGAFIGFYGDFIDTLDAM